MSGDGPRVAVVLGTRPEIIKLAPVIDAFEDRGVECLVVHTGQHYSEELDNVFFEQLGVPEPDVNLGVGSASHSRQTARMLAGIGDVLAREEVDAVVVQGDTNSTLAGALAAAKLGIPVGHVEAGLRSFDREMPEEVNRVVVDHVADLLFAPTEESEEYLERESVPGEVEVTGNTIVDTLFEYRDDAARTELLTEGIPGVDLEPGSFDLLTAHRAENVDDPERFASLLEGVGRAARAADRTVVYPVHPRASERLEQFDLAVPTEIRVVEPMEFFEFLALEATADLVFTDSGGVQEEACILGTPCVTLRYSTERPETVRVGANCLAGLDPDDIVDAAARMRPKAGDWAVPFGDGRAAERIADTVIAAVADRVEVSA